MKIAPPSLPELLIKLLIPLKFSTVWPDVLIAPLHDHGSGHDTLLSRKIVFPVNVRLLLRAMIAPAEMLLQSPWLFVNSLFPDRVMLVLFTISAVPMLSWKE